MPLMLAVDIPDAWIIGVATFIATTFGPGLYAFIKMVVFDRAKDHAEELAKQRDAFALMLQGQAAAHKADEDATRARYKAILDAKDAQAEELSKALSRKSDDHAKKIEELMSATIAMTETMGDKNGQVLDRALQVMSEFGAEVRRLMSNGDAPAGRSAS